MTLTTIAAVALAAVSVIPLQLPGADGPIGFDDLRFSSEMQKVIVPAGRSGRVDLIDPRDRRVQEITGFSASTVARGGHGESTTSADAGQGMIFASDRTRRELVAADARTKQIVTRVKLGGPPDYVRWVGPTSEVWVSEPSNQAIEIFRLSAGSTPTLTRSGTVEVPNGPESLEIDPGADRAYTNTWRGATVAIALVARKIVARWKNGCEGSRGLALDPRREIVFVGCGEGGAVALSARDGRVTGRAKAGKGVDVIAYNARLAHLYVPAEDAATVTVMAVDDDGALRTLGEVSSARGAHCATADDAGNVYVCDPEHGRLLTFADSFPPSSPRANGRTGR